MADDTFLYKYLKDPKGNQYISKEYLDDYYEKFFKELNNDDVDERNIFFVRLGLAYKNLDRYLISLKKSELCYNDNKNGIKKPRLFYFLSRDVVDTEDDKCDTTVKPNHPKLTEMAKDFVDSLSSSRKDEIDKYTREFGGEFFNYEEYAHIILGALLLKEEKGVMKNFYNYIYNNAKEKKTKRNDKSFRINMKKLTISDEELDKLYSELEKWIVMNKKSSKTEGPPKLESKNDSAAVALGIANALLQDTPMPRPARPVSEGSGSEAAEAKAAAERAQREAAEAEAKAAAEAKKQEEAKAVSLAIATAAAAEAEAKAAAERAQREAAEAEAKAAAEAKKQEEAKAVSLAIATAAAAEAAEAEAKAAAEAKKQEEAKAVSLAIATAAAAEAEAKAAATAATAATKIQALRRGKQARQQAAAVDAAAADAAAAAEAQRRLREEEAAENMRKNAAVALALGIAAAEQAEFEERMMEAQKKEQEKKQEEEAERSRMIASSVALAIAMAEAKREEETPKTVVKSIFKRAEIYYGAHNVGEATVKNAEKIYNLDSDFERGARSRLFLDRNGVALPVQSRGSVIYVAPKRATPPSSLTFPNFFNRTLSQPSQQGGGPQIGGEELFNKINNEKIILLYLSGYTDKDANSQHTYQGAFEYLLRIFLNLMAIRNDLINDLINILKDNNDQSDKDQSDKDKSDNSIEFAEIGMLTLLVNIAISTLLILIYPSGSLRWDEGKNAEGKEKETRIDNYKENWGMYKDWNRSLGDDGDNDEDILFFKFLSYIGSKGGATSLNRQIKWPWSAGYLKRTTFRWPVSAERSQPNSFKEFEGADRGPHLELTKYTGLNYDKDNDSSPPSFNKHNASLANDWRKDLKLLVKILKQGIVETKGGETSKVAAAAAAEKAKAEKAAAAAAEKAEEAAAAAEKAKAEEEAAKAKAEEEAAAAAEKAKAEEEAAKAKAEEAAAAAEKAKAEEEAAKEAANEAEKLINIILEAGEIYDSRNSDEAGRRIAAKVKDIATMKNASENKQKAKTLKEKWKNIAMPSESKNTAKKKNKTIYNLGVFARYYVHKIVRELMHIREVRDHAHPDYAFNDYKMWKKKARYINYINIKNKPKLLDEDVFNNIFPNETKAEDWVNKMVDIEKKKAQKGGELPAIFETWLNTINDKEYSMVEEVIKVILKVIENMEKQLNPVDDDIVFKYYSDFGKYYVKYKRYIQPPGELGEAAKLVAAKLVAEGLKKEPKGNKSSAESGGDSEKEDEYFNETSIWGELNHPLYSINTEMIFKDYDAVRSGGGNTKTLKRRKDVNNSTRKR